MYFKALSSDKKPARALLHEISARVVILTFVRLQLVMHSRQRVRFVAGRISCCKVPNTLVNPIVSNNIRQSMDFSHELSSELLNCIQLLTSFVPTFYFLQSSENPRFSSWNQKVFWCFLGILKSEVFLMLSWDLEIRRLFDAFLGSWNQVFWCFLGILKSEGFLMLSRDLERQIYSLNINCTHEKFALTRCLTRVDFLLGTLE